MPVTLGPSSTGTVPGFSAVSDGRWHQLGVIQFGNNAIPNIGGTLPWLNLNDGTTWITKDVIPKRGNHALSLTQNAWRSKASWIGEDFTAAGVKVMFQYDEAPTNAGFQGAIAQLLNSGEQYLTFDNQTGVLVKCQTITQTRTVTASPYFYDGEIDFLAREPWFKDLAQTSVLATAVAGSSGGTATNITYSYSGTWYSEPKFVLNIPGANTRTVSSLQIQNTTKGEGVTVTFLPVLTASTIHTVTVDCSTYKATDENGTEYDVTGTFPNLYPYPTGVAQNNAFTVTVTASGATSGFTFDALWNGRWVI